MDQKAPATAKAAAPRSTATPESELILADKPSAITAEPGPGEKAIGFIKAHPVAFIAGGIAIGVAASALLPRRTSRKMLGKAMKLAELAGAASMVLGEGKGAAKVIGRRTGALASKAGRAGSNTAQSVGKLGMAALGTAAALGKATASGAGDVGHRATEAAARIKERLIH